MLDVPLDPEVFGAWTARLFVVAVGIVIVATLVSQFLIADEPNPIVLGYVVPLIVIPLAGPAAVRLIRRTKETP